jgi:peptide/nickel transport system ATP-binding protein
MKPFLEVKDLSVAFPTPDGLVKAADGISFELNQGETLAIVGESGSGKSVTNLAIMGLHNRAKTQISGSVNINLPDRTIDVISSSEDEVRKLRGSAISMIFQDPMSSLHPYYSVGDQISEAWRIYNKGSKSDGIKRATEMIDLVGIPDAAKRVREFPHQFSGGMRQRVMIAMALVNNPKLIIADEPTASLDAVNGAEIADLLIAEASQRGATLLVATHDKALLSRLDGVVEMDAGRIRCAA